MLRARIRDNNKVVIPRVICPAGAPGGAGPAAVADPARPIDCLGRGGARDPRLHGVSRLRGPGARPESRDSNTAWEVCWPTSHSIVTEDASRACQETFPLISASLDDA